MACAWLLCDNFHPARTVNSIGVDTFLIPIVMVFSIYHWPQLLFIRDINPLLHCCRQKDIVATLITLQIYPYIRIRNYLSLHFVK